MKKKYYSWDECLNLREVKVRALQIVSELYVAVYPKNLYIGAPCKFESLHGDIIIKISELDVDCE